MLLQAYQFLIYLISGMLIGVLFDIFRILRRSFKTQDFITYVEDAIFWIITGIFLMFILLNFSNGEIRLYSIIGLALGFITYMLTISRLFIKINVKIVKFIKNVVSNIIRVIIYPFKLIIKILRKLFTPFTFFVINFKKIIVASNKKYKKIAHKRRILESNVEK